MPFLTYTPQRLMDIAKAAQLGKACTQTALTTLKYMGLVHHSDKAHTWELAQHNNVAPIKILCKEGIPCNTIQTVHVP